MNSIRVSNHKEYFNAARAIIIVFLIHTFAQVLFCLYKFILKRKGSPIPEWQQKIEFALDFTFSLGIISILLIISFSTYIFACVITYFFLFVTFFFTIGSKTFPENRRGLFIYLGPYIFLVMLVLNYWIDNQANI